MIRLRLCQDDIDEYGGDEIVELELDALLDERAQVLEEYEATIGMPITDLFHTNHRYSARGIRATLWIGRRRAGLVDDWGTFNPRVLRVKAVRSEDDADPPESTPESSEDTESAGSSPS